MDLDTFWQLIEQSGREYTDKRIRIKWLEFRLAELPRREIVDFHIHLDHCRDRIDSAAMWGAAHQICDGFCSDDGFWYFQVWLIGLGRDAFEHAAADPDHLADLIAVQRLSAYPISSWSDEQWPEWEALGSVARSAYGADSEEEMSSDLEVRGHHSRGNPRDPGEWWELDDPAEAHRRYPRLAQLFPRTGELGPVLPEEPQRPSVTPDPQWWAYTECGSRWTEPKAEVLAVFLRELAEKGNEWMVVERRCEGGEDRVVAGAFWRGLERVYSLTHRPVGGPVRGAAELSYPQALDALLSWNSGQPGWSAGLAWEILDAAHQ